MTKYKLNVARDVDTDEPGVYILNLPRGFRFNEGGVFNPADASHVQGFDTKRDLRDAVKHMVVPCACNGCVKGGAA